jgi:triacylglycerol lipase
MTKEEIVYSVLLSDVVYKEQKEINFKELGLSLIKWIDHKKSDTQGFVAIKSDTVYVVWRGSSSKKDFQNDASVDKVPFLKDDEKVHIGFLSSWDSVKDVTFDALEKASKKIKSSEINITVCGHSLGAAVSTLSSYAIKHKYPEANIKCCNIGSPRVGNKKFKENYNSAGINTIRIVHNNDVVTRSPKIGYHHVDTELRIDSNGDIKKWMIDWERAWSFIKDLFRGQTIKDHKTRGYIDAVNKWSNK